MERIDKPELGRRDPEAGPGRRDANVAGQGKTAAAADAISIDDGNRRLCRACDRQLRRAYGRTISRLPVGLPRQRRELVYVRAGAKRFRCRRLDRQDAHLFGAHGAVDQRGDRLPHRLIESVALFRAIENEARDAPVGHQLQPVAHRALAARSSEGQMSRHATRGNSAKRRAAGWPRPLWSLGRTQCCFSRPAPHIRLRAYRAS